MPSTCRLCDGSGTVPGSTVACPFHGTAVLVGDVPPEVLERIHGTVLDHARQHQLEPAGLTTPTRYEMSAPPRRPASRHHWAWRALGALIPALCAAGVALLILFWIGDLFS